MSDCTVFITSDVVLPAEDFNAEGLLNMDYPNITRFKDNYEADVVVIAICHDTLKPCDGCWTFEQKDVSSFGLIDKIALFYVAGRGGSFTNY